MHRPTTAPGGGYRAPPPLAAPLAPANADAQSANAHTTNDALNNLAAATAADRQAAANQAEAVANLTVSNQNLAQQLQQAQQQLQNMMSTMHRPTTAPGGGYRAPPPLAAPIAPLVPTRPNPGAADQSAVFFRPSQVAGARHQFVVRGPTTGRGGHVLLVCHSATSYPHDEQ